MVQIGVPKPNCEDIHYIIEIKGSSPEFDRSVAGIIPYFGCCLENPDPPIGVEGLRIDVNNMVEVNEQLVIEANLSEELNVVTLDSRDAGILPLYVLDKKNENIEEAQIYYENLQLRFENEDLDLSLISQLYNIHLLANQKVYDLSFPENIVGERSSNLNEGQNQNVIIYPNPSQGVINIQAKENIKELKVLSIDGFVIFEKQYRVNVQEVNSMSLPKGVHFVKVKLVSGKVITKKVIILE